jgi:hypothetical protein
MTAKKDVQPGMLCSALESLTRCVTEFDADIASRGTEELVKHEWMMPSGNGPDTVFSLVTMAGAQSANKPAYPAKPRGSLIQS